jgi:uncharacterized repeat protein (TIGR01451 family)
MKILNKLTKKTKILGLFLALLSTGFIATSAIASQPVLMEGGVTALNVTQGTSYSDSTNLQVDEVAQIQLWHHNRQAPNTLNATNTVVKFQIPSAEGKSQTIRGISSSDNGNTINDTTDINLSLDKASLRYEPGSAKFKYNKGAIDGRAECITGYDYPPEDCFTVVSLPDSVVTTGVNLDAYRGGPLKGCNAYHEYVTIRIRSVASSLKVNKYVRHLGETSADWSTHKTAKPGDTLEYMIGFENKGNVQLENVSVGDNLPKYHDYIEGSTKIYNAKYPGGQTVNSDNIVTGGIYVGDYNPGSNGFVIIRTILDPITAYEKCGNYELTNTGLVGADNNNTVYNTTKVTVTVECQEEEKIVVCENLVVDRNVVKPGETVTFTATGSAVNTAITEYEFEINGVKGGQSASNAFELTTSNTGIYTVQAYVHSADGQRVTGQNCIKTVEVETEEEKKVVCEELTASALTLNVGEQVDFTAIASASGGAEILGYAFLIDNQLMQIDEANTFSAIAGLPGTYEVMVYVISDIGEHTSENCIKTVTVVEEEEPVYTCEYFKLSRNKIKEDQTVEFTVKVTAKNGAEFKFATFTFGDEAENADKFVTNSIKDGVVTTTHKYKKAGTYKPNVAVTFDVNGEMFTVNDPDCAAELSVEKTPMCEVKGKEHLPVGHKDCKETEVLPDTGAGNVAGMFAAITAAGAVTHRKFTLRRK